VNLVHEIERPAWNTASMSHEHTATAPDGTSIAWSRTGTGDPVVLVHGITESAASFDPITPCCPSRTT
jgi:pimeloyl-ACP methyl ester carboxylesterase